MKFYQSKTVVEAMQFDGSIESANDIRLAFRDYADCFGYAWPPEDTSSVLSFQQKECVEDVFMNEWVVLLPNKDIAIMSDKLFNERYEEA